MTLSEFARDADLIEQGELEKVRLLAYYFFTATGSEDFTPAEASEWLKKLNLPGPNRSRLAGRLRQSGSFVRGTRARAFKLHARDLAQLQARFPNIAEPSEEVVSSDTILPHPLYASTRGFIEALAKQINAAYENNIFDGCAVLMRRLLEVLLVLAYDNLNISAAIKNANGDYVTLEVIISDAQGNQTLKLSRNSRSALDDFRTLGNFSAHKIYYNARRSDVRNVILEYRALIEELLYKAGIRT